MFSLSHAPQLNPDPTLCDGFSDETGCLSRKLAIDPLKTHCLWDQEAQVGGI